MMRLPVFLLFLLLGTVVAPAQNFIQLWQVGDENNSQADFAQENGSINPPPGSATAKDDDYYFAGLYPAPIGLVAENEPANTNFERANLIIDTTNRIHFNLDETIVPTTAMRLTIDVCCSSHGDNLGPSGPIPFEVFFNDNFLASETTNGTDGAEEIYTLDFLAGDVGTVPGAGNDNVVTIERVADQGGNWMQFDYIRLEVDSDTLACGAPICTFKADRNVILPGEQVTLTWITAPGASGRSIDQGVGNVEGDTVNGIGSVTLTPTQNTTYTLTSTLGGDTQTREVTVNVQIIESFTADAMEVVPGTEVFLDWIVDPAATVSIDNGIGNVDAETFGGVGFIGVTPTELETVYTLTATRGPDVETATVTVLTNPFSQLWVLGIDDSSIAEFAQERGGATPAPGDPAAVDDDYYFAGIYPALGVLGADEPVSNFERALLVIDPRVRIHFNLTPAEAEAANRFRVRVDVCCSNHNEFQGFSGPIDFSVLFNDVPILDATSNGVNASDELFFTDVVTGADINAAAGENVVTIERKTDQGGSWLLFDQIILETAPPAVAPSPIRITDISYDRVTGQFEVTWTSQNGELYTIESSGDLVTFGNLEIDFPPGGATGPTTTFSTNIPHATNPEFFVRVRKQD